MREVRGRCTERAPSWPTGLLGRRPPGPVAALPLLSERSPARARRSPPTFSVRMSGRGRGGSRGVVVRVFPSFPSAARRPSETRARRGSRECGRAGGGLAAGGREGGTVGRSVGRSGSLRLVALSTAAPLKRRASSVPAPGVPRRVLGRRRSRSPWGFGLYAYRQ